MKVHSGSISKRKRVTATSQYKEKSTSKSIKEKHPN